MSLTLTAPIVDLDGRITGLSYHYSTGLSLERVDHTAFGVGYFILFVVGEYFQKVYFNTSSNEDYFLLEELFSQCREVRLTEVYDIEFVDGIEIDRYFYVGSIEAPVFVHCSKQSDLQFFDFFLKYHYEPLTPMTTEDFLDYMYTPLCEWNVGSLIKRGQGGDRA